MRKAIFVAILILTSLTANFATAKLIDNGNGTITQIRDDGRVLMWLKDANYAKTSEYDSDGMMSFLDSIIFVLNLNFAGHDDWRLPNSDECLGYNCANSEMGNLYYTELGNLGVYDPGWGLLNSGPFINIQTDRYYWAGGTDLIYTYLADAFQWQYGNQSGININLTEGYVWPVRNICVHKKRNH